MSKPFHFFLFVTFLLSLTACGTQSTKPDAEQGGAAVETHDPTGVGSPVSGNTVDGVDDRTGTGSQEMTKLKDPKSPLSQRSVFFEYDSFVVRNEYKPLILEHANFLIKNPQAKMLIQGNADDRGSREYNLALGQKRAEAVHKLLILLGVPEEQLQSVSLGEEKQVCSESNEGCWMRNRRSDMLYSGEY